MAIEEMVGTEIIGTAETPVCQMQIDWRDLETEHVNFLAMIDVMQARGTLEDLPTESLFLRANEFDQTLLHGGRRTPPVKMLRELPTTVEATRADVYLVTQTCPHPDHQPLPQIVHLQPIQNEYLWSIPRDRSSSTQSVLLSLAEERKYHALTPLDAPEMTQEIGLHLGHSRRGDLAPTGSLQRLDVRIVQAVLAIQMHTPHLAVLMNHNRPQVLATTDLQIGLVIGIHPTDHEMLLHSSLHNLLLDQSIQITDD
jgi:hypothetical protein